VNFKSIRFRLISWYAGISLLVAMAFSAYTYNRLEFYLREVLAAQLERRANQIADNILSQIPRLGEKYAAEEIEARYTPGKNDKFVRVTRGDGSLVYLSDAPTEGSFLPEQVPKLRKTGAAHGVERIDLPNGTRILIAGVPYRAGGASYFVEVGGTTVGSSRVLQGLVVTLVLGLPVVMALAIFGGYVLIRRALAPVQRVTQAAQEITLSHLERRLPEMDSGDEIANLTVALNQMIARLDESFRNNNRFTADASHDLRTPLTILRGELESLVVDRDMPAGVRDKLGSLLEEIERLVKIVEGLFALSRLDIGEAQAERVQFDLAALAETTAEQMILLAEERKIALSCDVAGVVEVKGDRTRLKQAVVNLLDNAIKYTPEGGKITLSVKAEGGMAKVEVADNGIGIQEEALPHVFKRFFRAPNVRAGNIEGSGLGLAIIQAICNAHGGAVSVVNTRPSGCRFTVELPLAKSS
jgi:two-component system OmpR family sensor kinase